MSLAGFIKEVGGGLAGVVIVAAGLNQQTLTPKPIRSAATNQAVTCPFTLGNFLAGRLGETAHSCSRGG